jgi:hypothetical protein
LARGGSPRFTTSVNAVRVLSAHESRQGAVAEWIHEIKYDGYRMLVIPITTAPADQASSDTINASLKLMQQSQKHWNAQKDYSAATTRFW